MVICLEQSAIDLHTVYLMPLSLIITCFIKFQNGLPLWCHLMQVILEMWPLNGCCTTFKFKLKGFQMQDSYMIVLATCISI